MWLQMMECTNSTKSPTQIPNGVYKQHRVLNHRVLKKPHTDPKGYVQTTQSPKSQMASTSSTNTASGVQKQEKGELDTHRISHAQTAPRFPPAHIAKDVHKRKEPAGAPNTSQKACTKQQGEPNTAMPASHMSSANRPKQDAKSVAR